MMVRQAHPNSSLLFAVEVSLHLVDVLQTAQILPLPPLLHAVACLPSGAASACLWVQVDSLVQLSRKVLLHQLPYVPAEQGGRGENGQAHKGKGSGWSAAVTLPRAPSERCRAHGLSSLEARRPDVRQVQRHRRNSPWQQVQH